MIRRLLHLFFQIQILLLFLGQATQADPFRVVIDPGHGGSDEGTVIRHGRNGKIRIAEKDITLKLARQAAYQLRARGYLVTLTRNSDREVSLPARTALANRLGADIFISVHMNSTDSQSKDASKKAEGVETYILNNTTDASSRRLARLENSIISTSQEAIQPEQSDVALILKDLRLDANLSESKRLACIVQQTLVNATSGRRTLLKRDRGVKQALFHVLLGADMPSILVEAGFLNNIRDRLFVLSPRGQLQMSKAIANAVDEYKREKNLSKNFHQKTSLRLSRCKVN